MTVGTARAISTEMTIDGEGHTTYLSTYHVTVTDPLDTCNDVSIASGIPLYGDAYTWGSGGNPDAFCSGKHVSNIFKEGTNLYREVTATFTTKDSRRARCGNNAAADPVDELWKISGSFVNGTRVTCIDKDGAPTMTTAKEIKWFDVPDGYDTLTLEGPTNTISLSTRAQAIRKCNSATIWGLTARQLYLAQWQYEVLYHGCTSYVYHHLEFHINYLGWNEVWLNMGTQHLNADGKIAANPVSNDGLANNIRFLDNAGAVIAEASIPGSIVTITDQLILEYDFTSLGFPDPLPGPFV